MLTQELDENSLNKATAMLKAMAHPLRISILNLLKDGNELTVSQIHEILNIEQSTASHHLGILKDKGVLCSKRKGKNTFYFTQHKVLGQMIECMKTCACSDK
ncbi:MAG: metalloregulator ArsR/SmtB family transcription factor [Prolixibacteraceae bacterium]|jgi:DNA-binding transcriptional ArsR family regulator|nr:metalloregulator ArsR/SmtB family transcription factor [Prolixibacteraceae bacterium]